MQARHTTTVTLSPDITASTVHWIAPLSRRTLPPERSMNDVFGRTTRVPMTACVSSRFWLSDVSPLIPSVTRYSPYKEHPWLNLTHDSCGDSVDKYNFTSAMFPYT